MDKFFTTDFNSVDNDNQNEEVVNRRISRVDSDKLIFSTNEKKKYSFVGLSSGAGTTTIALAFAEYISRKNNGNRRAKKKQQQNSISLPTAFVEINDENHSPRGMIYDKIGMDKRFIGRNFISFYHLISKGKSVRGKCNPDEGINWVLRVPGEGFSRSEITDIIRLSENVQGLNVVLDICGNYGNSLSNEERVEELKIILSDSDIIFAIVDPLPSSLMADRRKFELLKSIEVTGQSVVWIINKLNAGVNKKELQSFLQLRRYLEIPFFNINEVYSAEYNCITMLSTSKSSEILQKCFKSIAELHNFNMVL